MTAGDEILSRTTRKRAKNMFSQCDNGLAAEGAGACASVAAEGKARTEQGPGHFDDNGRRLMSAFSIYHDGRYYRYNGYRYDRLADAVAYAEVMQSRPSLQMGPDPFTPGVTVAPPSAYDRELMAAWDISFKGGVYAYRQFRYDRLMDAVNYARTYDGKMR